MTVSFSLKFVISFCGVRKKQNVME
uniref:Uncharacterized protein n=1 Tax=Arundo donax TaxID=35708 RepID=A0A0A8ZXD8_ARUDO